MVAALSLGWIGRPLCDGDLPVNDVSKNTPALRPGLR